MPTEKYTFRLSDTHIKVIDDTMKCLTDRTGKPSNRTKALEKILEEYAKSQTPISKAARTLARIARIHRHPKEETKSLESFLNPSQQIAEDMLQEALH